MANINTLTEVCLEVFIIVKHSRITRVLDLSE